MKKPDKKNIRPSKEELKITQLESNVAELTEDLKRVQADYINFKRRSDEDKIRSIRFGRESAIMALLPVVDNIERALCHLPADVAKLEFAQGIKQVVKQLEDTLRGIGVERMQTLGQAFDPDLHDAIQMENGKGKKEIVVEELQPGYTMDGEVIRHAMVKVGKK